MRKPPTAGAIKRPWEAGSIHLIIILDRACALAPIDLVEQEKTSIVLLAVSSSPIISRAHRERQSPEKVDSYHGPSYRQSGRWSKN